MADSPIDPDNPEWTEEDFARARPASQILPPQIARLLVREAYWSNVSTSFGRQAAHARGWSLAA